MRAKRLAWILLWPISKVPSDSDLVARCSQAAIYSTRHTLCVVRSSKTFGF